LGNIQVFPVKSTAFLPVIFSPPKHPVTIHIAVYKENEFVEEVAKLNVHIDNLRNLHPDALFFLRVTSM
jgi:hypothetical protein